MSRFPAIKLPTERRHPLAVAVEEFRALDFAKTHHGRRILAVVEPRADKYERTRQVALKRKLDTPQAFALPKEDSVQGQKGAAFDACSDLSHAICFHLGGCRPDGFGPCFTCSARGKMTWGHFIAQGDSDLLRFHEHNTRPQCLRCQKEGQGRYREFYERHELEEPGRAAALEALHAELGRKRWRLRHTDPRMSLEAEVDRLKRYAAGLGLDPEAILVAAEKRRKNHNRAPGGA